VRALIVKFLNTHTRCLVTKLSTEIERNQDRILRFLYEKAAESADERLIKNDEIHEAINLQPVQINDAIELLHDSGFVEWFRTMGTAPYKFTMVKITPRGKYEVQRRASLEEFIPSMEPSSRDMLSFIFRKSSKPSLPIGSPYGFTERDMETVARRQSNTSTLYVVLGCKWESSYYNTEELRRNVESMFEETVNTYNPKNPDESISLEFVNLHAGYGEHLFNEIARDIISSDIAVFDISDLAPNIFLEIGVALTWGSRVFLIKEEGCPPPPSDISGQTYADYRDNAESFIDPEHNEKLYSMVERAIRKKG